MIELNERISLLTHIEWCKCINPAGEYGSARVRLEDDPRAVEPILMTWDQFKERLDEAVTG